MTVVAWDGKTLAADKRTNFGGLHATTTKLQRIKGSFQLCGGLVGCAGNTAQIAEFVDWLENGCQAATFPAVQRDSEKCVSALVVTPDGHLLQYENTPFPIRIENKFWAIGSGRDFAMAAMYIGKTAYDAALVACALDISCGNGIDALRLD